MWEANRYASCESNLFARRYSPSLYPESFAICFLGYDATRLVDPVRLTLHCKASDIDSMIPSTPGRTKPVAASLLLVLLFIAVCLPTGSIFGLNVKILMFVVFFAFFVSYLPTSPVALTWAEVIGIDVFIACLCFWSLVAFLNGQSETAQVFLQIKDIATTVVIAWMCILFIRRHLLRPESVIAAVVYGMAAMAVVKLALVAAMFGSGVDPIHTLVSVFGEGALIGGSIAFGFGRLEFSSDVIGGFVLFAILCPSISGIRLRRFPLMFLVIVLLASGVLAYARYIWFLEVFSVVAAMIIERRFKLLVAVLLAMIPIVAVSYEALQPLFEARFLSAQTTDSDLIRVEQARSLIEEIKARPFLGKGLGTHVNGLIRSEQNRYSYELQWMSLSMQFGVLGITGILLLIGVSTRDLLRARHPAKPWLILLFALWLLSAWTNPHLTASFAGATFGMFMAMFYRMRSSNRARNAPFPTPVQA